MEGADSKRPSGAQQRKAARAKLDAEKARERERSGSNSDEASLLASLGAPSLDPVGNSEWANNAAAIMAHVTLTDTAIPRETRFKQVLDCIDRIASSQSKALTAKRIREVHKSAGVVPKGGKDAGDSEQVGGGVTLRARAVPKRLDPVRGPLPVVSGEGDAPGVDASRGPVGSLDS